MRGAYPSNRKILQAMKQVFPKLVDRYGGYTGCTEPQLTKTCAELSIRTEMYPYLCAACLSEEAAYKVAATWREVQWVEVRNRAERLRVEYEVDRQSRSARFYDSGLGWVTGDV